MSVSFSRSISTTICSAQRICVYVYAYTYAYVYAYVLVKSQKEGRPSNQKHSGNPKGPQVLLEVSWDLKRTDISILTGVKLFISIPTLFSA